LLLRLVFINVILKEEEEKKGTECSAAAVVDSVCVCVDATEPSPDRKKAKALRGRKLWGSHCTVPRNSLWIGFSLFRASSFRASMPSCEKEKEMKRLLIWKPPQGKAAVAQQQFKGPRA
jgi:hypothetical protein